MGVDCVVGEAGRRKLGRHDLPVTIARTGTTQLTHGLQQFRPR